LCGEVESALHTAQEARALSHDVRTPFWCATEPGWVVGSLLVEAQGVHHATEAMTAAMGGGQLALVPPGLRVAAVDDLVSAAISSDDLRSAERWLAGAEAFPCETASSCAQLRLARAALSLATGAPDRAADDARAALGFATASGNPLLSARTQLLLGEVELQLGHRCRAIEHLSTAYEQFDSCGAVVWALRARRALRSLGHRPDRRQAGAVSDVGFAALTPREREIAVLLHERRTNAEIAEHFFLSVKTVETHLRNIFAKLGVSSRVEVARLLERGNGVPRLERGGHGRALVRYGGAATRRHGAH
jgi:DNA-binding CsgD family transcriptional regulator